MANPSQRDEYGNAQATASALRDMADSITQLSVNVARADERLAWALRAAEQLQTDVRQLTQQVSELRAQGGAPARSGIVRDGTLTLSGGAVLFILEQAWKLIQSQG